MRKHPTHKKQDIFRRWLIRKARRQMISDAIGYQFRVRGTQILDTIEEVDLTRLYVQGSQHKNISLDQVILVGKNI